jgi:hypothetical protein
MLNVIMLSAVMLNVIMLSVIMLSVIMLNVMAPNFALYHLVSKLVFKTTKYCFFQKIFETKKNFFAPIFF